MSLRVTVVDEQTGDRAVQRVGDGDYLLLVAAPARETHVNAYPKSGTHVITIKDVHPQPLPEETP